MWIKAPPSPLQESSNNNLNFLYQEGNCFMMDNHRAAPWAWLQFCNTKSSYNFIHIDRHYDLLDNPQRVLNQVIKKEVDLPQLDLSEYLDLKAILPGGLEAMVFSYDNYIANLLEIYPKLFLKKVFVTHEDGNDNEKYIDQEINFYSVFNELEGHLSASENKWIINIDIDYFFRENAEGEYFQAFTWQYIWNICNILLRWKKNIQVMTIAISPECCGSWDGSLKVAHNIANYLNLNFRLSL